MTIRYLLDTNILSELIDEPQGSVGSRIKRAEEDSVSTSIICAGELRFGVEKKGSARLITRVEQLLNSITILPLDGETDRIYGRERAALEARGIPIGANDLWIAAHALSLDLILVTDNVREFERVKGLRIENWLRD